MPLYGHELSETITPLECNLSSFVKLDKGDFIGREALAAAPPARRRIGLEIVGRGIAREGCPVQDANGNLIGETTSGGPAPTLGKNVAMALVTQEAAQGEEFVVLVRDRPVLARRVRLPFYKSPNK